MVNVYMRKGLGHLMPEMQHAYIKDLLERRYTKFRVVSWNFSALGKIENSALYQDRF